MIIELVSTGVGVSSAAKPWYKSSKVSAISCQMSISSSAGMLPRGIDASKWTVDRALMTDVTAGPGGGLSIAGLSGREMSTGVSAELGVPPGDVIGRWCVMVTNVEAWVGAFAG